MPRLTPLEIQKHEFSRKWKGFDPVEVESFLSMVAEEMEELARVTSAELEGRVAAARRRERGAPGARADPEGDAAHGAARLGGHPDGRAQGGRADRPGGAGGGRAADAQRPAALGRDREGDPGAEDPARQLPPAAPEDDRALLTGPRIRPGRGREGPAALLPDAQAREGRGRRGYRAIRPRSSAGSASVMPSLPPSRSATRPRSRRPSAAARGAGANRARSSGSPAPPLRAENGVLVFVGTEEDYRRRYAGSPGRRLDRRDGQDASSRVRRLPHAPGLGRATAGRRSAAGSPERATPRSPRTGGGINATVRATRAASTDGARALAARAAARGCARTARRPSRPSRATG